MASSPKQFSLFLLLTLFSSLHTYARDIQFFDKVPSFTNNVVVPNNKEALNHPQEQEPNFLPDKENGYGLYAHESGPLAPSATAASGKPPSTTEAKQPLDKYVPKNYNPAAYVTEPEDINDTASLTEDKTRTINPYNDNYYHTHGSHNYYNSQQKEEDYGRKPTTTNGRESGNSYYNGGSSVDSQPQGLGGTRFTGVATVNSREKYNKGGETYGFQRQGMSDTRFVENGKYFYDVNTEKYSSNHPYVSLTGAANQYSNRNYYRNSANNAHDINNGDSVEGYQVSREFREEGNGLP